MKNTILKNTLSHCLAFVFCCSIPWLVTIYVIKPLDIEPNFFVFILVFSPAFIIYPGYLNNKINKTFPDTLIGELKIIWEVINKDKTVADKTTNAITEIEKTEKKESLFVNVINQRNRTTEKGKFESNFGWGNFYIFMGFFQGGIAFLFSVIAGLQTEYLPNRGVGLLISILGIGSAIGLLKRKLIGLYLVYANLYIFSVLGLFLLFIGGSSTIIQGLGPIAVSGLWLVYFQKRKSMFN